MRIVFFGAGRFGIPSLGRLVRSGAHQLTVITRPDRPAGRGRKPRPCPFRAAATELGVPGLAPGRAGDPSSVAEIRALRPDIALVVDYGEILSRKLIAIPAGGCFGLHASVLPRYRGAAPIHHAILEGEEVTGVTIFKVVRRLDAGPIVATTTTPIHPDETTGELETRLSELGADLLGTWLPRILRGDLPLTEQDAEEATYAPKISKSDARIRWNSSSAALKNLVRAFHPWPGAHSYLRHEARGTVERLGIVRVEPLEKGGPAPAAGPARAAGASGAAAGSPARAAAPPGDAGGAGVATERSHGPGMVLEVLPDSIRVACRGGSVGILAVHPPGGREMSTADYLRGHQVQVGDRFLEGAPDPSRSGSPS